MWRLRPGLDGCVGLPLSLGKEWLILAVVVLCFYGVAQNNLLDHLWGPTASPTPCHRFLLGVIEQMQMVVGTG